MNYKLIDKLNGQWNRREVLKAVGGLAILATSPLTVPRMAAGVANSIDTIAETVDEINNIRFPKPLPHLNELYSVRVEKDDNIINIINSVKREDVSRYEVQRDGTYIKRENGGLFKYYRILGYPTIYAYEDEVLILKEFVRPELLDEAPE